MDIERWLGRAMWAKSAFFLLALWEAGWGLLLHPFRDTREVPLLTYQDTETNRYLVGACPRLRSFHPCPWATDGELWARGLGSPCCCPRPYCPVHSSLAPHHATTHGA
ncbi:hypothetical protein TSOC_015463, partial [Tetrabaena socialis]